MTLFFSSAFVSHSGLRLPYKIDCDAFSDEDLDCLARRYAMKYSYAAAIGIPTGGIRFAEALNQYRQPVAVSAFPLVIADDVLTTGASMEQFRDQLDHLRPHARGVVIFARGTCPTWVTPLFVETKL